MTAGSLLGIKGTLSLLSFNPTPPPLASNEMQQTVFRTLTGKKNQIKFFLNPFFSITEP